jgi:hypothetical protein
MGATAGERFEAGVLILILIPYVSARVDPPPAPMLNPDGRFSSIVVWALITLPIFVFRRM